MSPSLDSKLCKHRNYVKYLLATISEDLSISGKSKYPETIGVMNKAA